MNNKELIVVKRSGQRVPFNGTKIALAVKHAFDREDPHFAPERAHQVYTAVLNQIDQDFADRKTITVEDIQDIIEIALQNLHELDVLELFRSYRTHRAVSRESIEAKKQHKFARTLETLSELGHENQLSPSATLKKIGDIVNIEYAKAYLIDNKFVRAHADGTIFINHLNHYALGKPIQITITPLAYHLTSLNELTQLLTGLTTEVSETIVIKDFNPFLLSLRTAFYDQILRNNLRLILKTSGLSDFIAESDLEQYLKDPNVLTFKSSVTTHLFTTCRQAAEAATDRKIANKLSLFKSQLKDLSSSTSIAFIFEDHPTSPLILADISINLPRLAYTATNRADFIQNLQNVITLAKSALRDHFEYLGDRPKSSYPHLFAKSILPRSENLEPTKKIRRCLKEGSLNLSLVGLSPAAQTIHESSQNLLDLIQHELTDERYHFTVSENTHSASAHYFLTTDQVIFGDRAIKSNYYHEELI